MGHSWDNEPSIQRPEATRRDLENALNKQNFACRSHGALMWIIVFTTVYIL
jgi:hypothetical protein